MTFTADILRSRDPREDPAVSLSSLGRIDQICEQFEQAWRTGEPPSIERFLDRCDEDRAAALRELLAIELEYRARRGENRQQVEYLRRFPDDAAIVALALEEVAQAPTPDRDETDQTPAFLVDHPRYRIIRPLGSGGMGAVYLAKHLALEREVALKVIRPELLTRGDIIERFRREAQAAAMLDHPHVVTVYDAETTADRHFLVMEFIAGTDLFRLVREGGPLPVGTACDYARQAALGLQHAHERGMVHRDITPRNLMLATSGQVKILDFGLAGFVRDAAPRQGPAGRMLVGSIDFMAPEQAAEPETADIRADIYSLGCTLCYLLTGRTPFPDGPISKKLHHHAESAPPRLDEIDGKIPTQVADLVERMLSKKPEDRYRQPAEVAQALAPFAASQAALQITDSRDSKFGLPWLRGSRGWRITAAVVIAAALLAAAANRLFLSSAVDATADGTSPEARRYYREGLKLVSERTQRQVHAAIGRLEKAVELAPQFALAQTALADAYNLCGDYAWDYPDDVFPKAKRAAERALAQNPNLPEAHLALAFVLHAYDCDWPTADAEYRRTIELNPRLASAHHWYAWFLAERGRSREAGEEMQLARQLAPDDVIIVNNVGKLMYLAHDFAHAAEQHIYALELDPDFRKAHRDLGLAYAELGRADDALAEFEKSRGLTEDGGDALAAQAFTLARTGQTKQARLLLAELESLTAQRPLAIDLAAVRAALGDADQAFAWLKRAVDFHSAARGGLAIDPRFDALHGDPRWTAILNSFASK